MVDAAAKRDSAMPAVRLAGLCFLAAAALNLAWLGTAPLADTTEARHAEVGREFTESGHWLVPTLNGRPHLTKPPLTDWLVAAGIELFGANEFGARFFNAVLAALMLGLLAGLACRMGGQRAGRAAAVLCLVSPLYLALSRTICVDITLAVATVAGFWALWELAQPGCRRPWAFSAAFWLCAGLGGLIKGHMILLFLVAPAALWFTVDRRGRAAQRLFWPPLFLLMPAVALPWPLLILREFPDWLSWLSDKELGSRLVGESLLDTLFGMSIAMLAGGVLPALPLIPYGVRRNASAGDGAPIPQADSGARSLLACWLLTPLAVLSVVNYQRFNYVVPLIAPVVILAGFGWARLAPKLAAPGRAARAAAAAVPLLCAGALLAAATVLVLREDTGREWILPVCGGLAAAAAGAGALCVLACVRGRSARAASAMLATALLTWAFTVPAVVAVKTGIMETSRESCRWLKTALPEGTEVLAFREHIASSGFYLGRNLRPVRLVNADRIPEWMSAWEGAGALPEMREYEELAEAASRPGGVWLLLPAGKRDDLLHSMQRYLNSRNPTRYPPLTLSVFSFDKAVRVAHLRPPAAAHR